MASYRPGACGADACAEGESMYDGPAIDRERCTLCGRCCAICPKQILEIRDKKVELVKEDCILCSHCYAVCRFGAIDFPGKLRDLSFSGFDYTPRMIEPGGFKPGALVNLLRSRRSVRCYKQRPVPRRLLADLLECAVAAPSGSNYQNWEFIVLPDRERVYALGQEIKSFFEGVNRLARNPLVRWLSLPFYGMRLVNYYRNHYANVERGLEEARKGVDKLFYGAPALIIIHGSAEGSMPHLDAQYAAYNITLCAHAMGLGTCFIGYASESISGAKTLKSYLGIPPDHSVHAVLTVGYPDVRFFTHALRKPYKARWTT